MSVALCPECDTPIEFDSPVKIGKRIFCPECNTELEVMLDYAFDEEDWEEDWEEEE
jgi:hypothetical protein